MDTLERKSVKIGKDIYTITALECDVSGPIAIDLIAKCLPIVTSFIDSDFELLNKELRNSIDSKEIMDMFVTLINVNLLEKNGNIVQDWKVEFSRRPMALFTLGKEALRFNCEDFFDFISGYLTDVLDGINWKEITQMLQTNGIEIPSHILSLLPTSIQEKIKTQITV